MTATAIVARKLNNIALLRVRAQDLLKIFGPKELDEIWLFHPEPCDRDVELKNRLIREEFLCDAHSVLREVGSALCLKTDHPGYYQWTLALFGMAEPAWFSAPQAGSPRVKRRELMRSEDLPACSEKARRMFEVAVNSPDFWHDDMARDQTAERCFTSQVTVFEQRFIRKRLPIHYFEMRKR